MKRIMKTMPPPFTMPITVTPHGTVRPAVPEGDAFFGLEAGTNGTAAAGRRAAIGLNGRIWERHDGRPATGLQLVPSNRSESYDANPWSGNSL
jgi:hypothetical protein